MLSPLDRRRSLYLVHSALGVGIGIWLFAVAFTGAVSLFRAELETWSQPGFAGTPSAARGTPDRALASVRDAVAGSTSVMLRFPDAASGAWDVLVSAPGRELVHLRVDPATGESLGASRHEAATAYFRLHAYLLMPGKVGRYLVGALGVALLATAFSGVFMHRHVWRSAARVRLGRRLRIVAADLHRALGIGALLFHVLMGATGAYLGLKDLLVAPALFARFDGDLARGRRAVTTPPPPATGTAAPVVALEPLLAEARRAIPGLEPNALLLHHPGDAAARVTVLGTLPGHLLPEHEAERVDFDGVSGQRLAVHDTARSELPLRVFYSLTPLHFGAFGGGLVRILYFGLGLTTALLAASGAVIFCERRAQRDLRAAASVSAGPSCG